MTKRVLYFDDAVTDRETYSNRLSAYGRALDIVGMSPPGDLDLRKIICPTDGSSPDLVLIDYDLTQRDRSTNTHVNYLGGTLASAIRDLNSSIPLVLLTKQSLIGGDPHRALQGFPTFDALMYKGDVAAEPEDSIDRLLDLSEGYHALSFATSLRSLVTCLGCKSEFEQYSIAEAGPPSGTSAWTPAMLTKWLRDTLLEFPGVLYNEQFSSTLLGVSRDSFRSETIQEFFEDARYEGPFSREPRWWKVRLIEKATEFLVDREVMGPIPRRFAAAWGSEVSPSVCIECQESAPETVCYVLNQPVHYRCSIEYFADQRPAVMDRARVSYKAIRETNDVDDERVDPACYNQLRAIRQWPDR